MRKEGGYFIADYEYCKGCGICAHECVTPVYYDGGGGGLMGNRIGLEVSLYGVGGGQARRRGRHRAYPSRPRPTSLSISPNWWPTATSTRSISALRANTRP